VIKGRSCEQLEYCNISTIFLAEFGSLIVGRDAELQFVVLSVQSGC
jgi:hypothetical protein